MTHSDDSTTTNASLTRYLDDSSAESPDSDTDSGDDAGTVAVARDPEPDSDEQADASEAVDAPVIDTSALDNPHLKDLVQEFSTDEIRELIDYMLDDELNILTAVEEATDDEELQHNIDSVTDHYADRPSLVEAAGDYIEEAFGMRPFDLTITEPDDEYLTPMISLDVDEDVVLTENPELNAELLAYATRIEGVTKNGQRRVFNDWRDALGGEEIAAFKEDRDPDALGFAIPGQIPATGDEPGRTPITEIPYIGEATAEDLHPSGDLLSLEDLTELSKKQLAWIDFPVNNRDYDDRRARGIASGIAEHAPDDASDLIGKALDMIDRRSSDGAFAWVNPANAFGIVPDGRLYGEEEVSPVEAVDAGDDQVTVETEAGDEVKYSSEYWQLMDAVAEATGVEIEAGSEAPAFVELPDGGYLAAAPIQESDD